MHRLTRLTRLPILATFAAVWLACAIARADYVTVTQGGYGPFPCARDGGGPLPSWGFSEEFLGPFYSYTCVRKRGDVQTATHAGRSYSEPADPYYSVKVSQQYTTHYACYNIVPGNSPVPCDGGYKVETSDDPYTDDWRNATVLGYLPPCPTANGAAFTTIHFCTGSYTPYDGSGLLTAVIGDGHVVAGLPYGNPLKLQPSVGNDVSCVATMSNYPNVSNGGHPVLMEVYTCP